MSGQDHLNESQFKFTALSAGVHQVPIAQLGRLRDPDKDVLSPDEPADSEGYRKYGSQLEYTSALAESIRKEGVREPLELHVVEKERGARVSMPEGNHRLAAAEMAGLAEVPVQVQRTSLQESRSRDEEWKKKMAVWNREATSPPRWPGSRVYGPGGPR